jgi:hypothetical protein
MPQTLTPVCRDHASSLSRMNNDRFVRRAVVQRVSKRCDAANDCFVRIAVIGLISASVRCCRKRSLRLDSLGHKSPMTAQRGRAVIRQKPSDDRNEPRADVFSVRERRDAANDGFEPDAVVHMVFWRWPAANGCFEPNADVGFNRSIR